MITQPHQESTSSSGSSSYCPVNRPVKRGPSRSTAKSNQNTRSSERRLNKRFLSLHLPAGRARHSVKLENGILRPLLCSSGKRPFRSLWPCVSSEGAKKGRKRVGRAVGARGSLYGVYSQGCQLIWRLNYVQLCRECPGCAAFFEYSPIYKAIHLRMRLGGERANEARDSSASISISWLDFFGEARDDFSMGYILKFLKMIFQILHLRNY